MRRNIDHTVCEKCGKYVSLKKLQRHRTSRCGVKGEKKISGHNTSFRKMSMIQKLKDKIKNKGAEAVQNEMDGNQDKKTT